MDRIETQDTTLKEERKFYTNNIEEHEHIKSTIHQASKEALETTTTVTCTDENNKPLFQTTIPVNTESKMYKDIIANIINQHHELILIKTNSTKLITYRTENGEILHTGIVHSEKTEYHNQNQNSVTSTTYWEKVNKVIAKYKIPITMQVTTTKIVTYYVNGIEVRKEEKPVSGGSEMPSSAQIESTVAIICRDRNGNFFYETTVSGDKQ
ncbi:hypothetical protein FQA39_LY05851 [Lamprigera yunnana]|nr:hypothetical protein FQA39_LY05851 [Lamprigera yunnana]